MTKLLRSHFARLRHSKIFWLGMIFMFGIAIFAVLNQYFTGLDYGVTPKLDNFILGYALIIGLVAPVFSSLFLGSEYSDGTMRNKLVVGHSRTAIYFSSLLVTITATLAMCLAFILATCAVGIPLLGGIHTPLPAFMAMLLGSLVMACAECAILTAIAMLISNKALIAIASILCMLALILMAAFVEEGLQQPEFHSNVMIMTDGVVQVPDDLVPNPAYLTGWKRTAYEYAFDILPTGQALQYSGMWAEHLWQMPLYSLAFIILSTGLGLFFFRRKDLK